MIKLFIGGKGSGKTKTLIEMVNNAVNESKGNVICIEKGDKLIQLFEEASNRLLLITAYRDKNFYFTDFVFIYFLWDGRKQRPISQALLKKRR